MTFNYNSSVLKKVLKNLSNNQTTGLMLFSVQRSLTKYQTWKELNHSKPCGLMGPEQLMDYNKL